MEDEALNIAIISDQPVRAESLSKTIENGLSNGTEIRVLTTDLIHSTGAMSSVHLILVDLMGISKSSRQIILPLKEKYSGIKIIAMHLYRSSLLVNPLFAMGIDGYIYYEPSRGELMNAIRTVTAGKKYIPNDLLSA
ncbi:hypothetical protein [Rhodohalobacter sp. 614A]|uniref:hypothetical protein n=1 Tax=Rhodohalobacter sp. 614A TaxID=2908649 RepID=UPI001F414AE5|nr:hypothetical protein [Rhodohalobacter sp. 614A]